MNKDILEGNWKKAKGRIREAWGELTDDEIDRVSGSYDRLIGTVQEKYGQSRDEARDSVNEFLKKFDTDKK